MLLSSPDNQQSPGPGFQLTREPLRPAGLVLAAAGELDAASVGEFRELLNAAVDSGESPVVVDLSEVTFIDSLSLATIVRAQSRMAGRVMAIVARHPYVLLIIDAGGLGSVLDVFSTREEAVAHAIERAEPPPAGPQA